MIHSDGRHCRPPASLYVHVPFCRRRCHYCDFYSTVGGRDDVILWTETVKQEIRALSAVRSASPLSTVYFGGGTPSAVPAGRIASVLEQIDLSLGIAGDAEITLEANPESVSEASLQTWTSAGVNRLSLGVQTLDRDLLTELGRLHDDRGALDALGLAQHYVGNISCDLMIGLPGQTEAMLEKDLDLLLSTGIDHLSFYSLTIEPGTVFYERYGEKDKTDAEERAERAMYWKIRDRLAAEGFNVYEISNAARPGKQSRHNLVYWRALPYFAAGPGAASFALGLRMKNPDSLKNWAEQIGSHPNVPFAAAVIEEAIDDDLSAGETVMLGLRLTEGVSESDFFDRFGITLQERFGEGIRRQVADGLLSHDGGRLRLTRRGLDFANLVFAEFV